MNVVAAAADIERIERFWRAAGPERWFAKDDDFDAQVRRELIDLHFAAARRELDAWLDDPAALRAFIRKVVDERRPQYQYAYPFADALGDGETTLRSLRAYFDLTRDENFTRYWELWTTPYSSVRTLPGFKQLLRDAGVVDYWRQTGRWGDFCKPVGEDFECR